MVVVVVMAETRPAPSVGGRPVPFTRKIPGIHSKTHKRPESFVAGVYLLIVFHSLPSASRHCEENKERKKRGLKIYTHTHFAPAERAARFVVSIVIHHRYFHHYIKWFSTTDQSEIDREPTRVKAKIASWYSQN